MEQIIINTFIICIFSLVFVSINIVVGINIISKYFNYKATIFVYIGAAWLGMAFPWMPETLKFFFLIFQPKIDAFTLVILYLVVNIMAAPLFLILWVSSMNRLTAMKDIYKKGIQIATIAIVVLFEIMILLLAIVDPTLLLNQSKGADAGIAGISEVRYTVFWRFVPVSVFQIFLLVIVLLTGLYFAKESLESNDKDVKLKGKFLLIAFILFTIGGVLDALFDVEIPFGTAMKIVARIILMSSSISFFMGYILPEQIKQIFRK